MNYLVAFGALSGWALLSTPTTVCAAGQPQLRSGHTSPESKSATREIETFVVSPNDTADNDNHHETDDRRLVSMMYDRPSCNIDVESQSCLDNATPLSSLIELAEASGSSSSRVIVPCNTCAYVDITDGSTITLPAGLDIVGRLSFPSTANLILSTQSIFIQGILDMVKPNMGNKVTVSLYGEEEDAYFYPHDACDGGYDVACGARANVGKKPIVIAGGKLNINAWDPSCPSWTKLKFKLSNTQLHVDPSFASCLRPGDKLLVTSDNEEWANDMVRVVSNVNNVKGHVVLTVPITRPLPGLEGPYEPEYAVEVASLTRDVVFEGQEDSDVGAHFIVFHTNWVPQIIVGAQFNNMGQRGVLGRYPIHFHMSGSTPSGTNSRVSKNVITNSNQRCVFIHNTNGVQVIDNVAYNTRGHCYATETGNERYNRFENNLGARTRLLGAWNGQSDSLNFQTKHIAATYWVRSMKNEFVGNVAAGSEGCGWWLEMSDKKSDQLYLEPVSSFRDNVAHSNKEQGLTT
mmetsp:Transcript_6627/g.12509  ORF Transcript_6627/g.12509 Transcript_6627/m.12509 type:complete len:518 (-) Transcript_6627:1195-2748(-)